MSPERVLDKGEVSLDKTRYKLREGTQVQSFLSSIYPPKIVIGDTTRDSGTGASVFAMSDWRGGLGKYEYKANESIDKSWRMFGQGRQGHFVKPKEVVTTGSNPSFTRIGAIGELGASVYAAFDTAVHAYNNSSDTWGSSLNTLDHDATDMIQVRMPNGTDYLVIATTAEYDYTADGSSFTTSPKAVKYLAFWDDRLWGIDNTGQLWYSYTIDTETNDAKLPLPDGYVTDLFTGRDASGARVLYAATKVGLWVHDALNAKFIQTALTVPRNDNAGKGTVEWRGDIYYPVGMSIYKYSVGSGGAVISLMGPDRDDGLSQMYRGYIQQLIPTHTDLIASITGTVSNDVLAFWDGIGWQLKIPNLYANNQIDTYAFASYVYSKYRLYFGRYSGAGQGIRYTALDTQIVNPTEDTTQRYDANPGQLIAPWFSAGQAEVDKLALRLNVDTARCTSNETIQVFYYLNFDTSSATSLGTITTNGREIYYFPSETTNTGITFRSIQFEARLVSAAGTATPDLLSLTLEYRKKLTPKWGHSFEIDIQKEYKGKTADEQRAALMADIESTTLLEFTFRDDTGNSRNYYVDVVSATGLERTGHDETGVARIQVAER